MSETDLSLATAPRHRPVPRRRRPIVSILMQDHGLAPADAMTALSEAHRSGADVSQALLAEELSRPETILAAQSTRHGALVLDPAKDPPDPALAGLLPPEVCLRHAVLPWRRSGGRLTVATARPERQMRLGCQQKRAERRVCAETLLPHPPRARALRLWPVALFGLGVSAPKPAASPSQESRPARDPTFIRPRLAASPPMHLSPHEPST